MKPPWKKTPRKEEDSGTEEDHDAREKICKCGAKLPERVVTCPQCGATVHR